MPANSILTRESGLNSVANTVASSRGTARLELDGPSRSFGAYNALDGIDLAIEPGEFVALLARRAAASPRRSTASPAFWGCRVGEIRLGGKRIDQLEPERRGFGMVFQSYALFPHMSAQECRLRPCHAGHQGTGGRQADQ